MQSRFVLYLTLLVGLIFTVAPLPELVRPYRPDWLLLVLGYWAIALPHRVNVGTAFTLGLFIDVLKGSVLGAHALAFSVVAYIMVLHCRKIRNFSVGQQTLVVALLSVIAKLLAYWMTYLAIDVQFELKQLSAVAVNLMLWPWLFFLLRRVRRHFHIR